MKLGQFPSWMVSIALVLYPILFYYLGPMSISYGVWLFLIALLVYLIFKRTLDIFSLPKGYLLFWIYCAISLLITSPLIKLTYFIPGGIKFFLFSVILCFSIKTIRLDICRDLYRLLFVICAGIFAFQEYMLSTTNVMIPFVLPITDIFDYGGGLSFMDITGIQLLHTRAPSLFMESSYFAQFCLPLLAIELLSENQSNRFFNLWAIIILIVIFFSQSGCGYIGASLLLIIKMLIIYKKYSMKHRLFLVVMVLPALVLALSFIFSSEIGTNMLARSEELDVNGEGSGYLRVFRGYLIYDKLPFLNQIIGFNMDDDLALRGIPGLLVTGDIAHDTYFNGVQTILINKGLIGLILIVAVYYNLYKNNTLLGKSVVLLFLILSLTEATFMAPGMLMCTTIAGNEKLNRKRIYGKN